MFLLVRYQVSLSLGVCFTGALLFRKAEAVGMSFLSYTELPMILTSVRVPLLSHDHRSGGPMGDIDILYVYGSTPRC